MRDLSAATPWAGEPTVWADSRLQSITKSERSRPFTPFLPRILITRFPYFVSYLAGRRWRSDLNFSYPVYCGSIIIRPDRVMLYRPPRRIVQVRLRRPLADNSTTAPTASRLHILPSSVTVNQDIRLPPSLRRLQFSVPLLSGSGVTDKRSWRRLAPFARRWCHRLGGCPRMRFSSKSTDLSY